MKVQPIFAPNETEKAFAEAYRAAVANLPGADDESLAALRARAMTRFEAIGLPHRRIEEWRYTDLRRHLAELPQAGEATQVSESQVAENPLHGAFSELNPHWLVFVDGAYAPSLSGGPALPAGVEVRALSDGTVPGWARDEITTRAAGDIDSVFDLNTALMADGALIRVEKGVDAGGPLAILYLGHGGARHMRHVVVVEDGATLSLIEAYGSIGDGAELATAAVNWRIGDGAALDHVKVQLASENATHLATQISEIGANTRASSFTLTLGASFSREQRHVKIAGQDSEVSVSGTYLLGGRQHGDTTLVVTHAAPGCESRERFKGLVDDGARGVFQGSVIVERDAQKTDARQSVDALLLSDDARHDAKPELEIYADDVQCGHGATTGELDENALFYLRARGIPKADAERLLIQSFIHDGLEAVEHEGLKAALVMLADQRLAARKPGKGDA